MANTAKTVEVLFEKVLDTYEDQDSMITMTTVLDPSEVDMQNSQNTIWRPVEQHSREVQGWDLSAVTDRQIIEEAYPLTLEDPYNDIFDSRADDLRDIRFWERRAERSGKQLATNLNKRVAELIANTGSLFVRNTDASALDYISEYQAVMNERQGADSERYCMLNTRTNQKFVKELGGRQTLQGRPEDSAWKTGFVGKDIAGFDVYTGSFLPNLAGGADPATTVPAATSFAPRAATFDNTTKVVTNFDYRSAEVTVADASNYAVGDAVTFDNGGTAVQAVGMADKTPTGEAMTFKIVGITGNVVTIFPRPIAVNDGSITSIEQAYGVVDNPIGAGAVMNRVNTDADQKVDLFWQKDSIEIVAGDAPMQLFKEFAGQKVISQTLKDGLTLYMMYDGNIETANFTCRTFLWYGLTNKDPRRNGAGINI